jgi:adenine-specific DNA-methyltransferase
MENVFGGANYLAPLIWLSRAGKGGTVAKIQIAHEYVESAAKNRDTVAIKPLEREIPSGTYADKRGYYRREPLRQWGQAIRREDRPSMYFPIPTPFGIEIYPTLPDGSPGRWRFGKERVMKMLKEGDLDFVKDEKTGQITVYRKIRAGQKVTTVPSNLLDDVGTSADGTKEIQNLFGEKVYPTCKPTKLVERLVGLVSWQTPAKDIVLDFFAGSGTTGHAVINLNRQDGGHRKYILVEIGDWFETILLPRIKKVVFCENWKDGRPAGGDGISHIIKYHVLEQYEDTLHNIEFTSEEKGRRAAKLFRGGEYIKHFLQYETKGSASLLNVNQFENPFEYKLKVISSGKGEEIANVDLVETFNYLIGLKVNKYKFLKENGRKYVFVFGERNNKRVAVVWRSTKNIDLAKDKQIIDEMIANFQPDEIFINGDALVKNYKVIETEFKARMGV